MPGIATRASLLPGRTPSRGALAKTHARILGIGRRATAEPPSASPCRAPAQQAPVSIRGALGGRKKHCDCTMAALLLIALLAISSAPTESAVPLCAASKTVASTPRVRPNVRGLAFTQRPTESAEPLHPLLTALSTPRLRTWIVHGLASTPRLQTSAVSRRRRGSDGPRSRVEAATPTESAEPSRAASNGPRVDAAAPSVDRPRSRVDAAAPDVRGLASTLSPRLRTWIVRVDTAAPTE